MKSVEDIRNSDEKPVEPERHQDTVINPEREVPDTEINPNSDPETKNPEHQIMEVSTAVLATNTVTYLTGTVSRPKLSGGETSTVLSRLFGQQAKSTDYWGPLKGGVGSCEISGETLPGKISPPEILARSLVRRRLHPEGLFSLALPPRPVVHWLGGGEARRVLAREEYPRHSKSEPSLC
jgi:hypothetical protein